MDRKILIKIDKAYDSINMGVALHDFGKRLSSGVYNMELESNKTFKIPLVAFEDKEIGYVKIYTK